MNLKNRIKRLETKENLNKIDIISYSVVVMNDINKASKQPYIFKVVEDELKK